MGYGDEIMASYYAKGAAARGKRIAIGDGKKIIHHRNAVEIFKNNPNIAPLGSERDKDIEWITHSYRGNRLYNKQLGEKWIWIKGFNDRPGEIFFDQEELAFGKKAGKDFIVMEPNVSAFKKEMVANKRWSKERYNEVCNLLVKAGHEVVQFNYPPPYGPGDRLQQARQIKTESFRHALSILSRAKLFIGPEGGLHHGAAALGIRAVVIFGGFISPDVTGYSFHTNLYHGGRTACGNFYKCEHCQQALDSIRIKDVFNSATEILDGA